jgi:hypothetical protein
MGMGTDMGMDAAMDTVTATELNKLNNHTGLQ